jgi:pimeloyl-ACP methyl ester carboxylesterase
MEAYPIIDRKPFLPELLFLTNKKRVFDKVEDIWTAEQISCYSSLFSEPGALTAALNWYRAIDIEGNIEDALFYDTLYTPTLFIYGDSDPVVVPDLIPSQRPWINTSYEAVQLNSGHSMMQEQEEQVISAILQHISDR